MLFVDLGDFHVSPTKRGLKHFSPECDLYFPLLSFSVYQLPAKFPSQKSGAVISQMRYFFINAVRADCAAAKRAMGTL